MSEAPEPGPAPGPEESPDLRWVGDRIETLLEASSSGGAVARERAEELVRLVAELYGSGLERMLDLLYDHGALSDEVLGAFADDELVASLLLVHGLHPETVEQRVERALRSVRPYLDSHGGNVELVEITVEGIARLRLLGSCDGCASSSVTMSLAVEDAVSEAAPEITGFDVESPGAGAQPPDGVTLIPLEVIRPGAGPRADPPGAGAWTAVAGVEDIEAGEVRRVEIGGLAVVVGRNGTDLLAFRDACARCGGSLAHARLERQLGASVGGAVLTCPGCRSHFDVRRAGLCLDDADLHLEPLPLLVRDGRVSVAVPEAELR